MAERRMFAKTIIDSDAFLDMPLSTQALYFHLSMRADDDGFLNNANKIMRVIGANQNDLDLLLVKNFIIKFEDGICVIKHWRIHNYIQTDRYHETMYKDNKGLLNIDNNKAYTLKNTGKKLEGNKVIEVIEPMYPKCIHNVSKVDTQVRLGKDRLGKDNNTMSSNSTERKEIIDYLNLKASTNYKYSTKKTISLINARINEGFKVEDFKKVIDTKVGEWLNTEKDKYLRPETLFGNKFEGYLNQKPKGGSEYDKKHNRSDEIINEYGGDFWDNKEMQEWAKDL